MLIKETASLWEQGMGDTESGSGLPAEVHRLRTSDHDRQKSCGKKYQRIEKKGLNIFWAYVKIINRDILFQDRKVFPDTFCYPCSLEISGGQKTKRRYNKHEQIRISISC